MPSLEIPSTKAGKLPTNKEYLRSVTDSILCSAFDIEAAFEAISSNVQNGVYSNEYEFQFDLYRTFSLAKDGMFSLPRHLRRNQVLSSTETDNTTQDTSGISQTC